MTMCIKMNVQLLLIIFILRFGKDVYFFFKNTILIIILLTVVLICINYIFILTKIIIIFRS